MCEFVCVFVRVCMFVCVCMLGQAVLYLWTNLGISSAKSVIGSRRSGGIYLNQKDCFNRTWPPDKRRRLAKEKDTGYLQKQHYAFRVHQGHCPLTSIVSSEVPLAHAACILPSC